MNDAKEFQIVEEATRDIGLDEDTVTSMWELMSAILWLGNTTFGGTSSGSSKKNHSRSKSVTAKLDDSSYDALNNAASLLGIDSNVLIHALTNRTVVAGMETMVKPLNSDEAIYTRDALAKALYSKNFSQLVKFTNWNRDHLMNTFFSNL